MYCNKCGTEIPDSASFCPTCGFPVKNQTQDTAQAPQTSNGENTLAIVGFILSFFFAIIGLIVSAVALHKAKTVYNGRGKGLAIAGIVIGSIETIVIVLLVLFYVSFFATLFSAIA